MSAFAFSLIALRLMAIGFALTALWMLLGNLSDSTQFDPGYLRYFFRTELLRPLIGFVLSGILWLCSRWLARRLANASAA